MKTASRQHLGCAIERILFSDMSTGVAKDLFTKLENGVVPVTLSTLIVTPFNSTTNVLDIGHAGIDGGAASGNAYANDIDLKAAAGTRVAATTLPGLIKDTKGGLQLQATRVDTGAVPTAGEVLVILTFGVLGLEHYTHG